MTGSPYLADWSQISTATLVSHILMCARSHKRPKSPHLLDGGRPPRFIRQGEPGHHNFDTGRAARSGRLRRCRIVRALLDHLVDQAEFLRLLGGHEAVALKRLLDLLVGLASVLDVDLVEPPLDVLNLLRV